MGQAAELISSWPKRSVNQKTGAHPCCHGHRQCVAAGRPCQCAEPRRYALWPAPDRQARALRGDAGPRFAEPIPPHAGVRAFDRRGRSSRCAQRLAGQPRGRGSLRHHGPGAGRMAVAPVAYEAIPGNTLHWREKMEGRPAEPARATYSIGKEQLTAGCQRDLSADRDGSVRSGPRGNIGRQGGHRRPGAFHAFIARGSDPGSLRRR